MNTRGLQSPVHLTLGETRAELMRIAESTGRIHGTLMACKWDEGTQELLRENAVELAGVARALARLQEETAALRTACALGKASDFDHGPVAVLDHLAASPGSAAVLEKKMREVVSTQQRCRAFAGAEMIACIGRLTTAKPSPSRVRK